MPAPATDLHPPVSPNRTLKYSNAIKAAKKNASVIAVDCRYRRLGLSAASAVAATAASVDPKIRRAAANKKMAPVTKHAAEAGAAASPLRHHASTRVNGDISRWGRGSQ